MKKEQAVLGFIAVAVIGFAVGRLTAPGGAGGAAEDTAGKPAEAAEKVALPVGKSPTKGARNAKVTLVEFSDFQCPFCKRHAGTLDRILKEYGKDVRLVFKQNPLPFHKDAPLAAEAALAAGAQGKFWEMHDKLFLDTRKLKRPDLDRYATELGLDMNKFKAALDQHTFKAQVAEEQKLGKSFGARGTPATFINGKLLSGAQPFEKLKAALEAEIKEVDALIKKGTKLADVYAERLKVNLEKKDKGKGKAGPDPDKVRYKVPVGKSQRKGPDDALVTVVEFTDFQ